jgi:hypothetical protein
MTINLFFIIRFFDFGLLPFVVLLVYWLAFRVSKFLIGSSLVKVGICTENLALALSPEQITTATCIERNLDRATPNNNGVGGRRKSDE